MLSGALLVLLLAGNVEADIARAVARSGVRTQGLGIVVGAAGGDELYRLQPDEPRTPASNQKILTAGLALEKLGADFEFRTRFGLDADGALIVVGDGDPNFSGRFFEGDPNRILRLLARDLKKNGVGKVRGGILLDVSRFDQQTRHPDWPADQLDKWYCAPISALVYNDSCWDITVLPGVNVGAAARVRVEPSLAPPVIENGCRTVSERARHVIHIGFTEQGVRIKGGVLRASTGFSSHLAVKEPALFFGESLRAALIAEGVPVEGAVRIGRAGKFEEKLVYKSDLRRTLKVMLAKSQNLYAECVFKRAGGGSFAGGAAALRAIDPGIEARDGSGMSAANRVTPRAVYRMLQRWKDEPVFVDALASGGEGTLRRRYRHLGKRLRAKTGYIRGVSSLSGYVESAGKRYVFVVLCNGAATRHARKLQDLVVKALSEAK
ncbi:MAG: D-alanyl-D-alanine carboxypeptidase/D-alanyl-D-alanine endopeptidase [Planctomycetota bacterium]|jgi:D-alanyl-D-alanine carboxypeptidase/D-alanyl-D-alanine-endopeptidase (penicillin-binding protein 4)